MSAKCEAQALARRCLERLLDRLDTEIDRLDDSSDADRTKRVADIEKLARTAERLAVALGADGGGRTLLDILNEEGGQE